MSSNGIGGGDGRGGWWAWTWTVELEVVSSDEIGDGDGGGQTAALGRKFENFMAKLRDKSRREREGVLNL